MIAWWWLVVEALIFGVCVMVPITGIGRRLKSGELRIVTARDQSEPAPGLVCKSRDGMCRYGGCAARGVCLGAVAPSLRNPGWPRPTGATLPPGRR